MLWNAILDALAILVPVDCAGCSAPDRGLCAACAGQLDPDVTVRTMGSLRVASAVRYEGAVRRVILALKEDGRTDAAHPLANPLTAAIDRALRDAPRTVELLPVPTSRAAYRRRGYDPVRLLLRRCAVPVARVLVVTRRSLDQKLLNVAERAANRAGVFTATRRLDGRVFVIVDDVLTTGATLTDAARAVQHAGGTVLGAATLAYTPKLLSGDSGHPFRDFAQRQE